MRKVTPYFFALLLATISFYYTRDSSSMSPVIQEHSEVLLEQYYTYPYTYENREEPGDSLSTGLFHDMKSLLTYWNLSWYEIQYINNVNKQAVEEYKLAKTQEERNVILQKHPQYFTKIGRPLLSTCSR